MQSRMSLLMCLLSLLVCHLIVALSMLYFLKLMFNRLSSICTTCGQLKLLNLRHKSVSLYRNSLLNLLSAQMGLTVCHQKGGSLSMIIDDHALYKLTVKNATPHPELMSWLIMIYCRDHNALQAWMLHLAFTKFRNQTGPKLPSGHLLRPIDSECCLLALPMHTLPSKQS